MPSGQGGTGWVVVADEAIARLLTTTGVPGELVPLHALTDPAAHAKEGPRFLGLLRQELSAQVEAVVIDEVAKDLTHTSDDEVARRLLGGAPG